MRRRHRSYNKRKEPMRRQMPVLIECVGLAHDDPEFIVAIGRERYEFAEDPRGRLVAAIYIEDHIQCFLARPEMYQPAGAA